MALTTRATVARIVCVMLVVSWAVVARAQAKEGGSQASGFMSSLTGPPTRLPRWGVLTRMIGVRHYEYDERVDLSLDGSAIVDVNASIPALVALHGANLDVDPEARFDRQAVRRLYEGPGVTVREISAFRRRGRRFAHVRVDVSDIRQLPRVAPFSWSRYQLERVDREYRFVQDVGLPARGQVGDVGWTGDELIAIRLHLPSRINFHNSSENIERGNILVWEQSLRDRLSGVPLHMEAHMDTQSILYLTLWLFGGTFLAAMAALAIIIWWVGRKGRSMVTA